ncbi:MAG: hypothetical protein DRQ78_01980 [Epsilonproteobacteria bacterium]|nr:MAG: hypothetical protein DRQ78_01980 [Campylobacterota bacterium]
MSFLNILQDTRHPSLRLLDMAYIVVLAPLFLILKVPMMGFVFAVLILLYFKRTEASKLLISIIFILGFLAIFLSLYGAFSFRGLSRLKLFLELLVYVLIVVVSAQRLIKKINFYLLISPILFLALSLFFFHGIVMLTYVVFEIYFLLWMILAHRMQGMLIESFRSSMVMFMYSLPWVVLLFIFFPRISFEHASYGFKGEVEQRMGHDGTMYLDSKALLVPSERIVMEVGFEKNIPPSDKLYFRGSILYVDKKNHWERLPRYVKRRNKTFFAKKGKKTKYKVTLYPTQKRWLYMLEQPAKIIKNSHLDSDFISTVKEDIKEPIHYAATSNLSLKFRASLDKKTLHFSSAFNKEQNPQTFLAAQNIEKSFPKTKDRLAALLDFFKSKSLTYSLKPSALDTNHTSDSFLFDKQRGYCVHFASSFVTMSRMAGIPSRIVTGYKADRKNGLKDYLAVKESDAHAWAELYIGGHWVRVETTATAAHIEEDASLSSGQNQSKKEKYPLLEKVNLYLMYAKYQVETWILYYSNIRQKQLLEYAKNNPKFIFNFTLGILSLLILSFVIIAYFRKPKCHNEILCILEPLFIKLKKEGYHRGKKETLNQYLQRYSLENPENKNIIDINQCYEKISYAQDKSKETKQQLKMLIFQI